MTSGRKRKSDRPPAMPKAAGRISTETDLPANSSNIRHVGFSILSEPSLEDLLAASIELGRVQAGQSEEEATRAMVGMLERLFPERRIAVRLLTEDGLGVRTIEGTEPLLRARRNTLELTEEEILRHGAEVSPRRGSIVSVVRQHVSVFEEGAEGFSVPIVDGTTICGLVNIEYYAHHRVPPSDRSLIVQLAVQFSSVLRNGRLMRESVYLRDYLSKLLEHANAPIVVINRDTRVRVANRAFLALTGLGREDVVGAELSSMLPDTDRRRLAPVLMHAFRGETTSNFEICIARKNGSLARVSMNTASIVAASGEVESVIAIGRDVSEVRALEEQIIHAEKLATLGQLAAGVVHELNNPLTSISVYSDYLHKKGQRSHMDAGDLEKLRRIVESAERILNFTRDLVAYARPSAEEPRLLSIRDVVEQAVVFCEHVLDEYQVTVERRYDGHTPPVYGVKSQLHQVFINIITNACHAMRDIVTRPSKLVIETNESGTGVEVSIQDNGGGIPDENLERIFDPFYSTKTEGKGTGLGLSIVRNIVHAHGGTIVVSSRMGEGSRFEIRLPSRT